MKTTARKHTSTVGFPYSPRIPPKTKQQQMRIGVWPSILVSSSSHVLTCCTGARAQGHHVVVLHARNSIHFADCTVAEHNRPSFKPYRYSGHFVAPTAKECSKCTGEWEAQPAA
jgi:hypothetical protein